MITICIGKADAQCTDKVTLTSGMVQAVQVLFDFSEEWEGLTKIAVFSNGDTTLDIALDTLDQCYIPHEVMAIAGREVTCGIYGSKGEDSEYVAIPTVVCSLGKVVEGACPTGTNPAEPTPTMLQDHENRITALETSGGGGGGGGSAPTKMSELEQDLSSMTIGNTYISSRNISNNDEGGTMRYGGYLTKLEGHTVTINGTSSTTIKNVVTPTADTDAANKKYVDDITGDICTALDTILAMQSQYMGVSE